MSAPQILPLKQTSRNVAESIYTLMQASYQVEANLLQLKNFWPLQRTAKDIASSNSTFYGLYKDEQLAAVAEIEQSPICIASLVVHPTQFRCGFGTILMKHIIEKHGEQEITVSTASKNLPALSLYYKMGFQKGRESYTEDGLALQNCFRKASPSEAL